MTRRRGRDRGSRADDGGIERTRLGVGFVLLVGLSGGMMALQGDTSPVTVGLATLGGLIAGGALLWYLQWIV